MGVNCKVSLLPMVFLVGQVMGQEKYYYVEDPVPTGVMFIVIGSLIVMIPRRLVMVSNFLCNVFIMGFFSRFALEHFLRNELRREDETEVKRMIFHLAASAGGITSGLIALFWPYWGISVIGFFSGYMAGFYGLSASNVGGAALITASCAIACASSVILVSLSTVSYTMTITFIGCLILVSGADCFAKTGFLDLLISVLTKGTFSTADPKAYIMFGVLVVLTIVCIISHSVLAYLTRN